MPISCLHVAGTTPTLTVGPFGIGQAEGRIVATGSAAELSFVRRTRTNWNPPINAGDQWIWYSPDGTARLWTEENRDLVTVTPSEQVGIGTTAPHAGSRLHVVGNGNQGVILPQVSLSNATTWSPLAGTQTTGMIVYNTSSSGSGSNRVLPGYYFWNGSRWVPMQPWYPVMGERENTLYTIPGTCLCDNNCYQYTGTYIDLPPGRWAIVALSPSGVKSNTAIPPGRTVSGHSNNCSAASFVNAPHIDGRIQERKTTAILRELPSSQTTALLRCAITWAAAFMLGITARAVVSQSGRAPLSSPFL